MDEYFFVLATIDLFVLTFVCILTKLSETLNSKQKRGFFLAFVLIGVISILKVITIVVDGAPVHLRWLNILSNYLGFGLSPAVSLCLVYVLDKKQDVRRGFKTAAACEAAYLILLALMIPSGMVFSVSEENLYSQGDFFAFYVTAYFAAIIYLMICTLITAGAFQNRSRALVESICAERGSSVALSWDMPQGYEMANGTFDPVVRTLFLNPIVLQGAPECEAMFYLVHELRHAEQYQHPERFDAMICESLPYVVLYNGTCFHFQRVKALCGDSPALRQLRDCWRLFRKIDERIENSAR